MRGRAHRLRTVPWLAAAFLVGCGGHGCGAKRDQPPGLALVAARWRESADFGRALDEPAFASLAEAAGRRVALPAGWSGDLLVSGELRAAGGAGELVIRARLRLAGVEAAIEPGVAATIRCPDAASAEAAVERALSDLAVALGELCAIAAASPDRWIEALGSAEPDEQVLALDLIGTSKLARAVPAAARLLGDPRERVAEAAAEALARIGDRAAVPLIIRAVDPKNLRSEVRAIEAIGRIGGPEARAYLEMTATGHEVAEVRALSSDLLTRMER